MTVSQREIDALLALARRRKVRLNPDGTTTPHDQLVVDRIPRIRGGMPKTFSRLLRGALVSEYNRAQGNAREKQERTAMTDTATTRTRRARKSAPESIPEGRAGSRARNDVLRKQVVQLRGAGKTNTEIKDELNIGLGHVELLWMQHQEATDGTAVDGNTLTPKQLAKLVVDARDKERLSWGRICARTGLSESKTRAVYAEAAGKAWQASNLGKGGRPGNGQVAPKAGARKAQTTKTRAKAKAKAITIADDEQLFGNDTSELTLRKELSGKTVNYRKGSANEAFQVAELVGFKANSKGDNVLRLKDADGKFATVVVKNITSVS